MKLRLNWGSHPAISRVIEYNPMGKFAIAVLKYTDGQVLTDQVMVGEIEPTDRLQRFSLETIEKELAKRAHSVVA